MTGPTGSKAFSRRSAVCRFAALAASSSLALQSRELCAADGYPALNRFPRMMQGFMVEQVKQAQQRGVREKWALKSRSDAQRYVQSVQRKIAGCFGPRPQKTPLNAEVTGILQRDAYRIEKLIFESRPGFPVTANLYLPKSDVAVPGVIGTCGHSTTGKAAEAYQAFAAGLAHLGMACLIFDPIGQGERLQYVTPENRSRVGVGVREHIQCGNQQYLVGENLAMWRAWDGIRALDYLLARPEIDKEHVGVTGNSGGGTMTTWLCGLEQRWTMAAPSCFVTTFLRNTENELPADTEQCPPGVLAAGLDHEDFLIAMAPKPITILAKEKDFFDVRGSEEAYERIRRVYRMLGAEENVRLFVGPTEHGFSVENRIAMYNCFLRATGREAIEAEPEIELEDEKDLLCTTTGQVVERLPKTVFSFTRDIALNLSRERPVKRGEELVGAVRSCLAIETNNANSPEYRILRDFGARKFPRDRATTYAVSTEPGIEAICYRLDDERLLSRPPSTNTPTLLYVAERSSDAELRELPWLRELIGGHAGDVFTVDVRGIGESKPNTCGIDSFDDPYGCDYFYSAHSIMLARPYLGQKVLDVLSVIGWLGSLGAPSVHLAGHGWGALIATLSAVISDQVSQLSVQQRVASFKSLAIEEDYSMPLAYLPPDVLKQFDLPECDDELGRRGVLAVEASR